VQRPLWIFGLLVVLISGLLTAGGGLYEAYAATPLGRLFRYPAKFLHLYNFGLALIAAAGVNALLSMSKLRARATWADRAWLLNGVIAFGLIIFVLQHRVPHWQALAMPILIVAFAAIPRHGPRVGVALMILTLQAHLLSSGPPITHERPFERPTRFEGSRPLLESLRERGINHRVYLSPRLRLDLGLTLKQGMMSQMLTTGDYEPLSTQRHANFFDAAAGPALNKKFVLNFLPLYDKKRTTFIGYHLLNAESDLRLMNMASTRHFVVLRGDEVDKTLLELATSPQKTGIHRILDGRVRIYENRNSLPRAYLVSGTLLAAGGDEALEMITRPDFDARTTVVLELGGGSSIETVPRRDPLKAARIVEAEPERVVIEVEAERDGFLVLTDTYYAGWEARIGEKSVEILRANYLFRAVPVQPGRSTVTFEYRPQSLRAGIYLSLLTAAGIAAIVLYCRRGQATQVV